MATLQLHILRYGRKGSWYCLRKEREPETGSEFINNTLLKKNILRDTSFFRGAQSKTTSINGSQNWAASRNAFVGTTDIYSHLYKWPYL